MADKNIKLATFSTGDLREAELQHAINAAWTALLADPSSRAEVATELGIRPEQLGDGHEAPVEFATLRSHMTGGELALLVAAWAAKDVFLGLVSDEAKARLRKLVEKRLLPMVRRQPGGRGAVGPLITSGEDGDRD